MINVLCVESSPEEWACYSWPDQMQVTTGSTKEEATQAFLVLAEVSAEECRFFGPLIVTAYYTELANDGWEVYAYAAKNSNNPSFERALIFKKFSYFSKRGC